MALTMTHEPVRFPSGRDLVDAALSGDRGAFETLYREHVGRIFALCLRMVGDRQQAEELTQDVFVRAWRKLGSFAGRSAFSTWLHRLAVNVVISRGRSAQRHRDHLSHLESTSDTPVETPRGEATLDLERAIALLPPRAREVFVLHDVEGLRHREIAEITGMAVGTSKAHLHAARRKLREVLDS